MMKTILAVGTCVGVALGAASASAGACTAEIDALQKRLSSTDAGMGPTGKGEVAETGQKVHPPTESMNEAVEGKAASPADVANQNAGEATESEAAQETAQAGEYGASTAPVEAESALERARQFDMVGNEAACIEQIGKAKAALGK